MWWLALCCVSTVCPGLLAAFPPHHPPHRDTTYSLPISALSGSFQVCAHGSKDCPLTGPSPLPHRAAPRPG